MPNVRIDNHPFVGIRAIYGADREPYNPDNDDSTGILILGNGMEVEVVSAFRNWNDVGNLDMLYVYCPATRMHTHVIPAELGLGRV